MNEVEFLKERFSAFLAGAAFWGVLALFWRFSVSAFFWRISAFGAVNFFLDLGLLVSQCAPLDEVESFKEGKREHGVLGLFHFFRGSRPRHSFGIWSLSMDL